MVFKKNLEIVDDEGQIRPYIIFYYRLNPFFTFQIIYL